MSTEQEFTEAVQLLAAGLGMADAEDTPYLSQIHDRLDEIKVLLQQSHEASEAIRVTHEAAGIEGLPFDIDPVEVAEGRYRVELPGGIRLDVSHRERVAVIGNPDGTVDVVGLTRIEGIGEEVEARPVPGGAKAFAAMASGHRGIVEANGTIHLTTANGLDLVIRFPEGDQPDQAAGPDDPPTLLCEERD